MVKRSIATLSGLAIGAAVIAAPAPVSDVNSGSIEQRLQTLERMVSTRTNVQHRIQEQLDLMQDEVNELRGSVELHSHKLEQILQRQRELYLEIDKRIQAATAAPAVPVVAETTTQAPSMGESQAYDRAVNLILKDKRYDQAIPEFQAFLQKYPQSDYVANAHYWLGQLLFNKQDWKQASSHFENVVRFYADSPKRADSILKLGMTMQKLGNQARAQQLFEQVASEYPDSSARKLADARLRELKQGN